MEILLIDFKLLHEGVNDQKAKQIIEFAEKSTNAEIFYLEGDKVELLWLNS